MEINVERFNNGKYNLNTISNDQYIGNALKRDTSGMVGCDTMWKNIINRVRI